MGDDLEELLKFADHPKTFEDLVSISLILNKDSIITPGVLYNIFKHLAWEEINIIVLILTPAELTIIIDENDSLKCQEVLSKIGENT